MAGGAIALTPGGGKHEQYTGGFTFYVLLVAIVAASGGLLFGFDNGITGGVIAMEDFQRTFFPHMLDGAVSTDPFCKFDDHMLQLFTSSLFLAGAVAAMVGSYTCKRFGRKSTMAAGGAAFLIGTILVATAFVVPQLVVGRIVLGVGVGFATQATPLYLSELAPHNLRGSLNILFQLAVTIGILGAQLINFGTSNIKPWGWRLSLALGAVPALTLFIGSLMLPDTPNSLVQRGQAEKGLKVLRRVRGVEDVHAEFDDITNAVAQSNAIKVNPFRTILKARYRPHLVISLLIPIFQQLTGINAIMFYAPQLFESIGHAADAALQATVITGAVNVISTVVAIIAVDRLGRRLLFLQGGAQMIACQVIVGVLIQQTFGGHASDAITQCTIAFICIYVAGFAWSWGPLGWLVPSEISPLEIRAASTAINTATNFIFTFIIGQCFLSMLCAMKYGTFFFFAACCLIMTLFVFFCVPETRNVPIETLTEESFGKHWLWGKVMAGDRSMRGEAAFGASAAKVTIPAVPTKDAAMV